MNSLKITAWVLMISTLIFSIFFFLSVPSIDDYCINNMTAYFGINIWKNQNCSDYWDKIHGIEVQYNTSITFKSDQWKQYENSNWTMSGYCGLFIPENEQIIIRTNRTNCRPVNETITHELKHLMCYRKGVIWHNKTEAHQGCFLNITL